MKRRFKFILSSLILLSLIRLGENISISCPNVKYYKETEWVSTTNPKGKDSKCFYYNQYLDVAATNLNIKLWSNEYILCYNQRVNVKLISLTKMFCEIDPINLMIKSYIPKKSIDNHHISYKMTDLYTKYCLSSKIDYEIRNIMYNSLLKRKWINQKIKTSCFSIGLNACQKGLDGRYS